mmetsp:Transcript_17557/g.40205  ORF Transcript_17557/g.40205 Transcript_17557/m.40205 type:complete len:416 (-) Transcript_17557:264-1511(-)
MHLGVLRRPHLALAARDGSSHGAAVVGAPWIDVALAVRMEAIVAIPMACRVVALSVTLAVIEVLGVAPLGASGPAAILRIPTAHRVKASFIALAVAQPLALAGCLTAARPRLAVTQVKIAHARVALVLASPIAEGFPLAAERAQPVSTRGRREDDQIIHRRLVSGDRDVERARLEIWLLATEAVHVAAHEELVDISCVLYVFEAVPVGEGRREAQVHVGVSCQRQQHHLNARHIRRQLEVIVVVAVLINEGVGRLIELKLDAGSRRRVVRGRARARGRPHVAVLPHGLGDVELHVDQAPRHQRERSVGARRGRQHTLPFDRIAAVVVPAKTTVWPLAHRVPVLVGPLVGPVLARAAALRGVDRAEVVGAVGLRVALAVLAEAVGPVPLARGVVALPIALAVADPAAVLVVFERAP